MQLLELKKPAGTLPRSAVKRSSASAGSSIISIAELADKYNTVEKVVDENMELKKSGGTIPSQVQKTASDTPDFIALNITKIAEKVNTAPKDVDENGEPLSSDKKAAVREFKKRISGSKEEEASAKEPEGWRDLMRAIHRLRAAHRWGAEELLAIDALAKAANKMDLKTHGRR